MSALYGLPAPRCLALRCCLRAESLIFARGAASTRTMPKPEAEPVSDESSGLEQLPAALGFLAVSAAACWLLHSLLVRGVTTLAKAGAAAGASGALHEALAAVQPFAAGLKVQLELVVGPLAKLHFGLDTVVGVALLIALLGIGRSLVRANEIALQGQAIAKRAAKAGPKGD